MELLIAHLTAKLTTMSVDGDLLEAIRLRAYFLWQRAGQPSGGDIAFWDEARLQIEAEAKQRV